ncbi:LPS assembly lipoprotein LptE [Pseudoalteromonas denitrificans]|jgi:LPS-assembly lipoprotein|uniref:LPS-assembly lipoprotein LptE n=1 Tax=Pseudoalteromonas denitrificans DSM 6059 TaxID=1123010 RepID=A0A1I1HZR3_9GAMM|nr:LPS assembly lipoprotein LptE [Pseudoalteromonas denitrificans]SFC29052.1 LPS-assembly lipoprotein [Pseudoalteromonas denitrificans DSM 6059]
MPLFFNQVMMNYKQFIAVLLCALVLSGCGFKLKKASVLPQELRYLTVTSDDAKSALYRQLKKQLIKAKVDFSDNANGRQANSPQLILNRDKLDRRTLSLFKNGQVAEYELTYHVAYQLIRPGEKLVQQKFELYRTYQDDPNQALAKAKELDIILAEMRLQASDRIIRELSQL